MNFELYLGKFEKATTSLDKKKFRKERHSNTNWYLVRFSCCTVTKKALG